MVTDDDRDRDGIEDTLSSSDDAAGYAADERDWPIPETVEYEGDDVPPVVDWVWTLLRTSILKGSTAIRIEPEADRVRVQLRIGGDWLEEPDAPKVLRSLIAPRIKILAGTDLTLRDVPHVSRFRFRVESGWQIFSVTMLPRLHGEAITLRLVPDELSPGVGEDGSPE